MKRPPWLHFHLESNKLLPKSKGGLIVVSASLLVGCFTIAVACIPSIRSAQWVVGHTPFTAKAKQVSPQLDTAETVSSTPTDTKTNTMTPTKTGALSTPSSSSSSSTTPPPMNRPGNRYVDQSSAGPEKLTYNEERSLIITPASLTVYTTSGAPVSNDAIGMVYQHFRIDSDDGQITQYPLAANAGGTSFGTQWSGVGAPTMASWPIMADSQRATPGTYTVTFTAWSLDRQIRYTGSIQLTILPLPTAP